MKRLGLRGFLRVSQRHDSPRRRFGVKGTPSPCFLQECDSMGVKGWGCAKNLILKGIVVSGEWREGGEKQILRYAHFGSAPFEAQGKQCRQGDTQRNGADGGVSWRWSRR